MKLTVHVKICKANGWFRHNIWVRIDLNFVIGKIELVLFRKVTTLDHVGFDKHAVIFLAFEVAFSIDFVLGCSRILQSFFYDQSSTLAWAVVFAKGFIELNPNPELVLFEGCLADKSNTTSMFHSSLYSHFASWALCDTEKRLNDSESFENPTVRVQPPPSLVVLPSLPVPSFGIRDWTCQVYEFAKSRLYIFLIFHTLYSRTVGLTLVGLKVS